MTRPDSALLAAAPLRRALLWAEFVALFAGVPVAMAVFYGRFPLFPVLLALTILAVVLLALTPGFAPRELVRGPVLGAWRLIAGFALAGAALALGLALALVPERVLELPRYRPDLWLRIMLFYPVLSAIPQELIYRALFFRRFGALFPDPRLAVAANALAFGGAHLFYMNPVAIGLTGLAGLALGWSYQRHGSVLLTAIMHALGGMIVFTSGLGIYFYHGAIGHTP